MVHFPDGSKIGASSSVSDIVSQQFRNYFYIDAGDIAAGKSMQFSNGVPEEGLLYILRDFRIVQLAGNPFYAYIYDDVIGGGYVWGTGMIWQVLNPPFEYFYTQGDGFYVNVFNPNAGSLNFKVAIHYIVCALPEGWVLRPRAGITVSDATPIVGQELTFTDASLHTPTWWHWTFGDGGESYEQNPLHTYSVADTYTVRLVCRNAGGLDVYSGTLTVT